MTINQTESSLTYIGEQETLRIDGWGRDGLRIRISPTREIADTEWALTEPVESSAVTAVTDTSATIRNGRILARIQDIYTQKGYLSFFRLDGDTESLLLYEHNYRVHAHNPGTRRFGPAPHGLHTCELHLAAADGERLYGMGENAIGRLDLKGTTVDLYQRHVKAVVPFVVSNRNYGFLWNNPSLGRVEFGTNLTRWVSYGCRQIDYFVTTGAGMADIMENYANATGHAPPFPYWASGFWQCKLRYTHQHEFLAVAREFNRRQLPLSVLVIDFLHWDVTGNWRLDPEKWPDPEAMVKELHDMGVRIMISPWTLVDERSDNFAAMKKRGLFTGSVDGTKDTVDFDGPKYQYDPTNPEAAEFLWQQWKRNYFDIGIRTFWLDPCDEFHGIDDYDQVMFHIGPALESHAYFPVAHQRNVYNGLIAAGEHEVVTICRNAWAGSQKYGACPAPHDILSSFEHLEEYIKVGLNVAMSGIPWWSCDIGGFVTHDNTSPQFHELMIRWYQYAVFTPVFRTHGHRPNNEPWNIGGDSYRHIRSSLLLRERLRPYIMDQMELASSKGLPPMRPLLFDFAADPKSWEVEDQFMFGPDLIVAPVTRYEQRERDVYLPPGVDWIDARTAKRIRGGQTLRVEAPLERIPVYVSGNNPGLLQVFARES